MTKPKQPRLVNPPPVAHPAMGAAPLHPEGERIIAEHEPEKEVLMPTAENAPPPYICVPRSSVTTLEVMELAMMRTLHLLAPDLAVEPGALRQVILSAERVAQLSPEAQRHMRQVSPEA